MKRYSKPTQTAKAGPCDEVPVQVVKETARLKKRLHHEFKNMIANELAMCRTSQAQGATQLKEIEASCLSEEVSDLEGEEECQTYPGKKGQLTAKTSAKKHFGAASDQKMAHSEQAKPVI